MTHQNSEFLDDVLSGLSHTQKSLSPRWFYDARGSDLFEAITALPEYYLTRAENRLLQKIASELADLLPHGGTLVEYGSGSSTKTPIVVNALRPVVYVPVDVSPTALNGAVSLLQPAFPDLIIHPICGDFTQPDAVPRGTVSGCATGFFPGSTIGNFAPDTALNILRGMRTHLGDTATFLIGVDQCSNIAMLESAYNDESGVTAAFNLNVLRRINRELNGTVPVEKFDHHAFFNSGLSRIEMHVKAQCDLHYSIAGHHFNMAAGETIHTENSHKLPPVVMENIMANSGWAIMRQWTDAATGFAIYLANTNPASSISEINRNTL